MITEDVIKAELSSDQRRAALKNIEQRRIELHRQQKIIQDELEHMGRVESAHRGVTQECEIC